MQRFLLVMAMGTGKTFVAMQIIYRLYIKGIKKKILFLVGRTALAEQTFDAFVPFKDTKVWIGQIRTQNQRRYTKIIVLRNIYIPLPSV